MLGCTELTQLSATAPSADRSFTHLKIIKRKKKINLSNTAYMFTVTLTMLCGTFQEGIRHL